MAFGGVDNPAGFIRSLIQEGTGPTEGLRLYRDPIYGGEIQDSRWFDLYRQVAATVQGSAQQLALDPYSVPGPTDYETWSMGKGGQFATQVDVQILDRDTGLWFTKSSTYVTDQPHTPEDAENDAFAMFGDPDTQNNYGETVMGALAVNFYQTTPFGA